jgi:hypothetical protein
VKAIKAPIDLSLNSEEEISQKRELPGHIIRTVLREGVTLGPHYLKSESLSVTPSMQAGLMKKPMTLEYIAT